jgi:ADYC domain
MPVIRDASAPYGFRPWAGMVKVVAPYEARTWARVAAALALLLLCAGSPAQAGPVDAAAVRLDGTGLVVTLRDGSTLAGEALTGVELRLGGGDATYVIRIQDVALDPHAHDPSVMLYDVAVQDAASGRWAKLCAADPYGRPTAIPVPGFWDDDGAFVRGRPGEFSFACTAGAQGKCVRFGYPPWARAPSGESLAPYHQACVRMVRADYCGDGTPHTVLGVAIEIFDRAGVHARRNPGAGAFEALWGPDGAVCLARSRRPEFPRAEILRACPRLAGLPVEACTAGALNTLGALLGNRS